MTPERTRELFARLYRKVPRSQCQGRCQSACGPILASPFEVSRVEHAGGKPLEVDEKLQCSMLTAEGRCSVYPERPLICRLFGVVRAMSCPFGCRPERWLTESEAHELLARAQWLGRKAGQ